METQPIDPKSSLTSNAKLLFSNPWVYPLLASFLLAALFGFHRINDSDIGFHLANGRWIMENHKVPSADSFTYTVAGRPYVDMEWLYQVFLYLGYRVGGYSLLSLAHITLAVLAFYILFRRLRLTGAPDWIAVCFFALALLGSEARFRVRPEVPTWVLLGLTLFILESRMSKGKDLLYLLPILQLVWVNSEGLFFLGPVLMGFFILSGLVHSKRLDPKLVKVSALSFALCLANPHLLKGLLFPFSFLTSLGSSEIFKYAVQEFQPPWSYSPPLDTPMPIFLLAYKIFSLFLFFVLAMTWKNRKFHEWFLALFFFTLSYLAIRNIPLFLLACAPLAALAFSQLKWIWVGKLEKSFFSNPLVAGMLTLCLLGFSARILTNAHWVENRLTDRIGLGMDAESQPVRACRFLVENHLDGKVVNDLDSGDWLDWQGPQKTFMDSRLDVMGSDFFREYTGSQGPGGVAALVAKYQPDLFFFKPLVLPQWMADLSRMPDWRLVYLDSVTAIYLRKGYADQVPTLDYGKLLADYGISRELLAQSPSLLRMEPPAAITSWLSGFFIPSNYPNNLLNLGIFCGNSGAIQASEFFFLEGIQRTQGKYYDFYYNLGLLYAYIGRKEEAALCMKRVLMERPDNPTARQIANQL